MKRARFLGMTALIGVMAAARASADAVSSSPVSNQDPDAVPQIVVDAKQKQNREAIMRAEQEKSDKDQDWLLRGYEEQAQARSGSSPGGRGNFYYQPGSDKKLSEISGLPMIEGKAQKPTAPAQTGSTASVLSVSAPSSPANGSAAFKPLVVPLSGTYGSSLHNLYSDLPASSLPETTTETSTTAEPVKDVSAMDTPGLTAAESGLLGTSKISFDESDMVAPDASHPSPSNGMNADLVQRATDAALAVPGAKLSGPPAPVNSRKTDTPDDRAPVRDKTPQPSPVRQPVGNPLDIPYH